MKRSSDSQLARIDGAGRWPARRWSARPARRTRQALRDKWCSKVHMRFFVGGAEGDAFGTIVYNGARQAAARHRRAGRLCLLRLGEREDDPAIARGGRGPSRRHRHDGPSRRSGDPAAGAKRPPRTASR